MAAAISIIFVHVFTLFKVLFFLKFKRRLTTNISAAIKVNRELVAVIQVRVQLL
jgi:hypothetical protein